jgi:hypothetical protein
MFNHQVPRCHLSVVMLTRKQPFVARGGTAGELVAAIRG